MQQPHYLPLLEEQPRYLPLLEEQWNSPVTSPCWRNDATAPLPPPAGGRMEQPRYLPPAEGTMEQPRYLPLLEEQWNSMAAPPPAGGTAPLPDNPNPS
ncbi:Hypothetical predicted protein [Scomber scombrus]|uniref:Uncharacterized protein n=1 Tax=Scomber scombrus TaxID=13677 RepID=A0AAV1QMP5_SCOSC